MVRFQGSVVGLCLLLLAAGPAYGWSGGITTANFGASGCNQCHSGGTDPTTTLSGPTSVGSGSTNTYTLTVTNPGSQTHAGLNVSATGGTFAVGGGDSALTQVDSNQITHSGRKMNVAGTTTFTFNWTAPASFTSVTMRGWGNAVDFSFSSGGDKADDDTLTITNSDPTPTLTPTVTATPTATVPPPICPPTPDTCSTPGRSSLSVKTTGDATKDALSFRYSGGPTTNAADFGDPTMTTSYALCIYQNGLLHLELSAPPTGTCAGKPCWALKTKGFSYKDKEASPSGVTALSLAKGDEPGKAKIGVKAKGLSIPDPVSIPLGVPVAAQVHNSSNANCWGDSWTLAEIDNDGVKFKAKSSD